jgi:hypothetical protein
MSGIEKLLQFIEWEVPFLKEQILHNFREYFKEIAFAITND